jgi:rhomboid family GlyGly-CTERM serine protease
MSFAPAINRQGSSVYLLLLACLLLAPWAESVFNIFVLDRQSVAQGQFWRLWTGHFVHLSWSHLLLSGLGIVLLQQLFGGLLKTVEWFVATAAIAPAIAMCWVADLAGPWFPRQQFDFVVGLSGLLHGLFTFAAVVGLRLNWRMAAAVLVIMLVKVLGEVVLGPAALTEQMIGLPVVVDMHVYGIASGLLLGAIVVAVKSR